MESRQIRTESRHCLDYLDSVQIDEGLTISNPGSFIEGVTYRNLLTVDPRGRNECLMNALKRLGLAEKTGRGIDRIFEGSLVYGRPLPDYSGSTDAFVKVFFARAEPDEPFMHMLADEQRRTGKTLSLRALLVLNLLKQQRRVTVREFAEQLHFNEAVIRRTVEGLVESGLVETRGDGPARSYLLSAKVYKAAGKTIGFVHQTDIDAVRYPELILRLAQEQDGSVTTRDVEELLHVQNKRAYRLIRTLVDEGRLKKRGSGPATKYELVG